MTSSSEDDVLSVEEEEAYPYDDVTMRIVNDCLNEDSQQSEEEKDVDDLSDEYSFSEDPWIPGTATEEDKRFGYTDNAGYTFFHRGPQN